MILILFIGALIMISVFLVAAEVVGTVIDAVEGKPKTDEPTEEKGE